MRLGFAVLTAVAIAYAQDPGAQPPSVPTPGVEGITSAGEPITPFVFNGDVRDLPKVAPVTPGRRVLRPELPAPPSNKASNAGILAADVPNSLPLAPMPSSTSFAGLNFNDTIDGGQAGAGWPPDTNGDVGLTYYIQAVNDAYAIYDKATGARVAAFTENSLWSAGGTNPCNGNSYGDPIVVYDTLADRWILSHFAFTVHGNNAASPFYQCIAVSQVSGNPVSGGWYFYPVKIDTGATGQPPTGTMNDYPKFGLWNDNCLYYSANGFKNNFYNGAIFGSFNLADMYAGNVLTPALGFIATTSDPFTMIPSNLRGKLPNQLPLAGTPNYYVSESNVDYAFEVRKFTPGSNCGPGGTMSSATNVSQTTYVSPGSDIVPQPNSSRLLDSLGDRLMQKVQYRKVGGTESLWVVHSVQTSSTSTVRPQWAQIDVTGGTITTTPVQQQIFAPDTTLHRWMGSIAADNQGNVALGYSTSNGTSPNFPSIAYVGRLATDPLNDLPQSETVMVAGAGSQTGISRWGDYTAMSVDPVDDCTFWYTNQYYSSQTNGSSGNWQTRIGSFKFSSCTAPTAVTIASFSAVASGDGRVLIEWQAASEIGNLGYNVYREVDDAKTKVNSELILSGGLLGPITPAGPRNYSFRDLPPDGRTDLRYWLEAVDDKGQSSWTGPVTMTASDGTN